MKNNRIIVIGDIILDKYVLGTVERVSPEAPVPILRYIEEKYVLGGAANVVNNLIPANFEIFLVSAVGDDEAGDVVLDLLNDRSINTKGIIRSAKKTTVKVRYISASQQLLRIDHEDCSPESAEVLDSIYENVVSLIKKTDIVLISDYNKGVLTKKITQDIIQLCREYNVITFIDPAKVPWDKYENANLIKPNRIELLAAASSLSICLNGYEQICKELISKYNLDSILLTLSEDGIMLVNKFDVLYDKIDSKKVYDVSGAGDTVLAYYAICYYYQICEKEAINICNTAAGIAISEQGTYALTRSDYESVFSMKIEKPYNEKLDTILRWKDDGHKIIFTNGCFDVIHKGHIELLKYAKLMNGKVVVAINSDSSVRNLKGTSRPVNSENDRVELLKSFKYVDLVLVFHELTPEKLLKVIRPDILIKGGDYKVDEIVGKEYANETIIVPYLEGYSSTSIVQKMRGCSN